MQTGDRHPAAPRRTHADMRMASPGVGISGTALVFAPQRTRRNPCHAASPSPLPPTHTHTHTHTHTQTHKHTHAPPQGNSLPYELNKLSLETVGPYDFGGAMADMGRLVGGYKVAPAPPAAAAAAAAGERKGGGSGSSSR